MRDVRADAAPTSIAPATAVARYILRTRDPASASAALAIALPTAPLSTATTDQLTALWNGPDEWLLMAPAAITRADHAGALVDISDAQLGYRIAGPGAETMLMTGCPLDLRLRTFPVNACARTVFAKAAIIVWRTEPMTFHLEIGRSFAAYVVGLLEQARADWGFIPP